jgi:hypothetical protein
MNIPSDKEAARLAKLFAEAERYIERLIADAVLNNPEQRSLLFWRRRAQVVHAELERISKQLLKKTPDLVGNSYRYGQAIAAQGTDVAVVDSAAFGSGINERAIALLAAGMNRRLDASLATVGRRVDDAFRQAGLRAAAFHALAGTERKRASAQMAAMLKREGIRAFVDKAGRKWTLENYTAMVIRTTTREAVTQGTYNGMQESGHELVKVSHHINACDLCMQYDGKTFAFPNAPLELRQEYGVLDDLPPFHPNCKHVIAPSEVEFDKLEEQLLKKYGAGVPA